MGPTHGRAGQGKQDRAGQAEATLAPPGQAQGGQRRLVYGAALFGCLLGVCGRQSACSRRSITVCQYICSSAQIPPPGAHGCKAEGPDRGWAGGRPSGRPSGRQTLRQTDPQADPAGAGVARVRCCRPVSERPAVWGVWEAALESAERAARRAARRILVHRRASSCMHPCSPCSPCSPCIHPMPTDTHHRATDACRGRASH